MLAALGALTIVALLAALISKRASPLVALITIPIIAAAMCASGARSPDAPTDPWAGTSGTIPLSSMASSNATVAGEVTVAASAEAQTPN